MEATRLPVVQRFLEGYSGYFDVTPLENDPLFVATAAYHSRSEKYVLVHSAKLWAAESHEYVYFASVDTLSLPLWQQLSTEALTQGMRCVKPHSEHMYSFVTLIIVADTVEPEAAQALAKVKFHRNFMFAFHGWADLRCAAVNISTGAIITNARGKELKKSLAKYL